MVFSSPTFLFLFFPLTLILYFLSPGIRAKNWLLVAASLLFYSWGELSYISILFASIGISYVAGLLLDVSRHRRIVLAAGITLNLLLLFYFKYFSAVSGQSIHLPAGISFYVFHAISYLVDVYRREAAPQKDLLDLALYFSFFPQLIAGPIVRYVDIHSEIHDRRSNRNDWLEGSQRFMVGFVQKVLVANTLATVADPVFGAATQTLSSATAWVGAVAYFFQLYFDFSGYSNMAIGLGRVFGLHLKENFDYPYQATSMTDFWNRWHISLSRWFRTYLYIPLGGNRVSPWKHYRNLLAVFVLCGLWHGASWNFLVFGLYHGGLLVLEKKWLLKPLARLPAGLRHSYAILGALVGFVLFRAETLGQTVGILGRMFWPQGESPSVVTAAGLLTPEVITVFFAAAVFSVKWERPTFSVAWEPAVRTTALFALYLYSLTFLAASNYNPFLYFRF